MIDWHRLFGMALVLHFAEYPLDIDLEKEMAIKRQILDVLIMKKGDGPFPGRMPDGLEDLAPYNLLTYKSMQETLDDWVLQELTGHYVNYRKVISPSMNKLLPREQFGLFAVSTRYPQKLANQLGRDFNKLQEGVYQAKRGTNLIRVIVLKEIPKAKHNLIWQLFSAEAEKVQEAAREYFESDSQMNTMINQLLEKYNAEGIQMPYTIEDYRKESARWLLNSLTPEEVLTYYKPEQRLSGLAPKERLSGLAPEEVLAGLSAKNRESLAKLLQAEQAGINLKRDIS